MSATRRLRLIVKWVREFLAVVRDLTEGDRGPIDGEYETEVMSHRTGLREQRERERLRKRHLLADLERRRREIESA